MRGLVRGMLIVVLIRGIDRGQYNCRGVENMFVCMFVCIVMEMDAFDPPHHRSPMIAKMMLLLMMMKLTMIWSANLQLSLWNPLVLHSTS